MKKISISKKEAGQKLLKLLAKYLNTAPQSFLHKMLRKKNITLNGKRADGSEILKETDEVCLFLSEETIASFRTKEKEKPEQRRKDGKAGRPKELEGIRVVYEDADVLVLNKPTGVLSQKAVAEDVTVNEWVTEYLLNNKKLTKEELETFHPGICNRLDRNTSGLITAGKSIAGLQMLSKMFQEHSVRKEYFCIVCGTVEKPCSLKGFLEKDEKTNTVTVKPNRCSGEGAYIETEYTPVAANKSYTLLKVRLITGKTHQIRAHLASVGHPLIGDVKYGSREKNREVKERFGLQHQLLHAAYLTFPERAECFHGLSGQCLYAPVPEQFAKIAKAMGVYEKHLSERG